MEINLNDIETYYKEKNNNNKCDSCENDKLFLESKNKLIFSCGDDKGKCGIKIEIYLFNYINSLDEINYLQKIIRDSININKLNKLYGIKYIINIDEYNKKIENINKNYIQYNDILTKEKLLETLLSKRKYIYKNKDKSNIKKFIEDTINFNNLYNDILNIISGISDIIVMDMNEYQYKNKIDDVVGSVDDDIDVGDVDIPLNDSKQNYVKQKVIIKKDLYKGNHIKYIHRNKYKYGIIKKINKKTIIILSNNLEYSVKINDIIIVEKEEYDKNINLKENLDIGNKVFWLSEDKTKLNGLIVKLNKIKCIIKNEHNIEFSLSYDKLFIL
mgnify:CR=1 FL=1|tara:strand:+ start:7945 stop:8931 length:987 start_codon:yes stop_codon:yes gene_type:complete